MEKGRETKVANDIANIRKVVAVGSAIVGADLLQVAPAHPEASTPYPRVMDGFAVVGSAAAGDFVVEIFVDGRRVGTYANTSTGTAIDQQKDLMPMDIFVRANARIEIKVADAANTNDVAVQIEFHKPKSTYSGRRTTRRSYGGRRSGNYPRVTGGQY